jgi:hypothetical protein
VRSRAASKSTAAGSIIVAGSAFSARQHSDCTRNLPAIEAWRMNMSLEQWLQLTTSPKR